MAKWSTTIAEVNKTVSALDKNGCDIPFFRGQSDVSWCLLPSIARKIWREQWDIENPEENLYFDFVTKAGSLLPEGNSSWLNVFSMQHYGLPTRLLDWTETFSIALYFALRDAKKKAVVWVLDPYALNKQSINREEILHPTELENDYNECFFKKKAALRGKVIAISPLRHNPRVFYQRSGFTLHSDISSPLENLYPDVVKKITITKEAFKDAWLFLNLAGISEFVLYSDLDGLSRELNRKFFE